MDDQTTVKIYVRSPDSGLSVNTASNLMIRLDETLEMQARIIASIAFDRIRPSGSAVTGQNNVVIMAETSAPSHLVSIVARSECGHQISIPARLSWQDRIVLTLDDRAPTPWSIDEKGDCTVDWAEIHQIVERDTHRNTTRIVNAFMQPDDHADDPMFIHPAFADILFDRPHALKTEGDIEGKSSIAVVPAEPSSEAVEDEDDVVLNTEAVEEPLPAALISPATAPITDTSTKRTAARPMPEYTSTMRVMQDIPSTGTEHCEFSGAAATYQQYKVLAEPVPLLGGAAMIMTNGMPVLATDMLEAFPWMTDVIGHIVHACHLQIAAGRPWFHMPPLLMVGPPGSGKSSFVRHLSAYTGVAHTTLDCAATHDAVTLAGTPRGFSTATPCLPAVVMERSRSANPIIQLDEIEKASRSRHGFVPNAVLGMTEPATSANYYDQCLLRELNLTACTWIATANDDSRLGSALRSRFDIVRVPAARGEHLDAVITNQARQIAKEWSMRADDLAVIPDEARKMLRDRLKAGSLRSVAAILRRLWSRDIVENGRPGVH